MTATPSFGVNPDIHKCKLIRILRSGDTSGGNSWCSLLCADGKGHQNVALAASEEFDLDLLSYGKGLWWKFKARPSKRYGVAYRCLPLAEQPEESIQEAMARKQGEETATPDPVTVDCPADAVIETKLIKQDLQQQMLNEQHWRLAAKHKWLTDVVLGMARKIDFPLPKSSADYNPEEFTQDPEVSF